MLLQAEHLSINFGSRQLLSDVDLYLNEGDKVIVKGNLNLADGSKVQLKK